MKRLLAGCCAVALALSAGAAWADDEEQPVWAVGDPAVTDGIGVTFLFATAQLQKDVSTNELVNITTLVNLDQLVDDTAATAFAEASAMAKQTNTDNHSNGVGANGADTVSGAGVGNVGMVSINQAGGSMNNQGTLVSLAIADSQGEDAGFAHAQAEATQTNGAALLPAPATLLPGFIQSPGNDVEAVNVAFRDALITGSLNDNTGLVYANQAVGMNNNQLNVLALAFTERPSGVALAEADLGQFNTENHVGESDGIEVDNTGTAVRIAGIGVNKSATIDGSLIGNLGVFGANQAAGNNANQANMVSVAAIGTDLPTF